MSQFLGSVTLRGGSVAGSGIQIRGVIKLRDMHPEAALRELRPAAKKANFETIKFWHRRYLPGHFKESAMSRYNYDKRTPQYMRAKAKRKRHQKPLVWSGELEQNAVRQIRTRGTSKRARGLMPGTQKANFGRRADMPPMRKEMLRTTRDERQRMAKEHETVVADQLRSIRGSKTRRV